VVSSTPRPHFTPGKDPVPIVQETGWAPGSVWTGGKSRPHRDSIPDRPARSQSLYRLSYRAHVLTVTLNKIHVNKHKLIYKYNVPVTFNICCKSSKYFHIHQLRIFFSINFINSFTLNPRINSRLLGLTTDILRFLNTTSLYSNPVTNLLTK
jgi:hypothetical protein